MKLSNKDYMETVWKKVRVHKYDKQQKLHKQKQSQLKTKYILQAILICISIISLGVFINSNFDASILMFLCLTLLCYTSYSDLKIEE